MPLPLRPQRRIHAAEVRIALHSDARHVIQRMAQARVTPVPHHHLSTLATLPRDRGDPTMCTQDLIVSFGQGLGGFRTEPGRHCPPDPGQRLHNHHIRWILPLARLVSHSAQQGAYLLATGLQLLGQDAQTGQQEPTRGLRGFWGARGNGQRRRLSACQHLRSRDAADAMRLEHPLHLLLTQQHGVGGGGGQLEQVPQPGRIGRRAQLEHLGIKPVQLLPSPIGTPPERFEQRFFHATELS